MIRAPIVGRLAVGTARSAATDARDSPDDVLVPTLDERANFYLRAIYGDRDFTNEEYLRTRNLLLEAMAADIAERSTARLAEDALLPNPRPAEMGPEHLRTVADTSSAMAALELNFGADSVPVRQSGLSPVKEDTRAFPIAVWDICSR